LTPQKEMSVDDPFLPPDLKKMVDELARKQNTSTATILYRAVHALDFFDKNVDGGTLILEDSQGRRRQVLFDWTSIDKVP
jgi:hypothetical protein